MRFVARTLRPSTRRTMTAPLPANLDISKLIEAPENVSERSTSPRTLNTLTVLAPLEEATMLKVLFAKAMFAFAATVAAIAVVPLSRPLAF